MNAIPQDLSRRALLRGGGALIVSFSLLPQALAQTGTQESQNIGEEPRPPTPLPGSLKGNPFLDSWIRIDADGTITVVTGKIELGQGIKTALLQIAGEELNVDPGKLKLITADTSLTPNEGFTAGSHSVQDSGTAIRHAAAQVREILIGQAAQRLGVAPEALRAENGRVLAGDGRALGFGELVAGGVTHVQAQPQSKLKDPKSFAYMGKPMQRIDIPGKLTGAPMYVQDMRLPGMVHGRPVRPSSPGARLVSVDTAPVEKMPGVLKVVRSGSFLGVIAEKEWQAVTAMRRLGQLAKWEEGPALPKQAEIYEVLQQLPRQDVTILDNRVPVSAAKTVRATYRRPYQMHASIGPSCALGLAQGDQLTIWSHSQGMFPLRKAVAQLIGLPDAQVRCIHVEGSGCYGHNAADDAAADAAILARAFPDRPVRVQWMREQENGWEPFSAAMVMNAEASLDAAGRIIDWNYGVFSPPHNTRPGSAGNLLAGRYVEAAFQPDPTRPSPQPEGSGDRNAIPLYHVPSAKVVHHFIPRGPLRSSAMRGLGAYGNVFSIESFMDELAHAAGADPVEFRLRHMEDARARDVIQLAAEKFGWQPGATLPRGRGRGFGFARYKNLATYCAVAMEIEVDHESGRIRPIRAVSAVDSGEVVNPDGIRNQIEGGIVQSTSWTLYEHVTYDTQRVTSRDWSTYPIIRFPAVPDSVEVHIIPRPGAPFLGAGEASQGPTAGALANAVFSATGARIRELPFSRDRVKAAIGA